MSELDRLLEAARQAEPDGLSPQEIDSEIGLAQITGRARHRAWVRRRLLLATGVGTALAAAAVLLVMLAPAQMQPSAPEASATEASATESTRESSVESTEAPATAQTAAAQPAVDEPTRSPEVRDRTTLELPTGDRLLAARGARFRVESASETERSIQLLSGTMLFDVRPSARGRFHVETSDARVTVMGTVFTVSAEPSGTVIRVYEGRVQVTHGESREIIAAGETSSVPAQGVETIAPSEDPLSEAAERAVARRLREPATSTRATNAPPAPPEADEVRGWIAGDPTRALRAARERLGRGDSDPWALIEADALRALGRRDAAARAYTRAATLLPTPRREQAGFIGARLHRSAEEALRALDVGEVSEPGSPLRERGLAMRADLLARLGREAERAAVARVYLESYPNGSRGEGMRAVLGSPSEFVQQPRP